MKNRYSRVLQYLSFGIFLFLVFSCAAVPTKTELGQPKSDMFVSTKELMDRAVSERADEFAPDVYTKAVKYYLAAEKDFEKGKDTAKVQEQLDKAEESAKKSIELSQAMQNSFPELVESRDKAIAAGAEGMDLESYQRGQKYFLSTAVNIQKNGLEKARENAKKALDEFQVAELEAIQNNIVGDLREQIKTAEKQGAEEWAPETYQTAINYRDAALETLEKDRYNQKEAQQQVEQGEYYTRKAVFLTDKIKEAKGDKANWEKTFLEREEDLSKIAMPLGVEPDFDEGYEKPVSEIDQAISELKEKEQTLSAQLMKTEQSLAQAQQEIRQAELSKERISSELQATESTLRQRKEMEEKVNNIQKLFTREEARVTMDPANNITITLLGLNFDTAKSNIKEENYPLLTDVQTAAQIFPDRKIRITGHTDSVGSSEFNQKLSLQRARSVARFMEEALGVPASRIETIGAGESEPIAPNTTSEGRRLNRRIDVTFMAPGY